MLKEYLRRLLLPQLSFTSVTFIGGAEQRVRLNTKDNGVLQGKVLAIPDDGIQGVNYEGQWYNISDYTGHEKRRDRKRGKSVTAQRAVVIGGRGNPILTVVEGSLDEGRNGKLLRTYAGDIFARIVYRARRP